MKSRSLGHLLVLGVCMALSTLPAFSLTQAERNKYTRVLALINRGDIVYVPVAYPGGVACTPLDIDRSSHQPFDCHGIASGSPVTNNHAVTARAYVALLNGHIKRGTISYLKAKQLAAKTNANTQALKARLQSLLATNDTQTTTTAGNHEQLINGTWERSDGYRMRISGGRSSVLSRVPHHDSDVFRTGETNWRGAWSGGYTWNGLGLYKWRGGGQQWLAYNLTLRDSNTIVVSNGDVWTRI